MAETQDNIPQEHQRAVDAHFDSLSPKQQARARANGFKPYRELPRSGDTVMELDEARACFRIRQTEGPDATQRPATYTRDEVLAVLAVVLDTIGGKRCPVLRGQAEVVRIGLGIGSKLTHKQISKLLGCSRVSVVQQVACFRTRMEGGLRRVRGE